MAKGNRIILTPDRCIPVEGIIASGETPKPGQIVQIQTATAVQGNRYTWELYNVAADGSRPTGPFILLTEDIHQGKTTDDAYAAGARAFGAIMLPGCEFNGLLLNVAGTGDDHAVGEVLIVDDTTGKFIATTGSPETEVAVCLEAVTDPTADTLVHMQWTGY